METFDLEGHDWVALHNLLKLQGWCDSGGMAKQAIANGEVKVDDQVETRKRCKITAGKTIAYAGQVVSVISLVEKPD